MTKGTERSGVYAGTYGNNVHVYNNTFYLEGTGATRTYGVTLMGNATDIAENNVFYFMNADIQGGLVGASGNTVDYNLYYPMMDSEDVGAHSLVGDPLFAATGTDFHLTDRLSCAWKRRDDLALQRRLRRQTPARRETGTWARFRAPSVPRRTPRTPRSTTAALGT